MAGDQSEKFTDAAKRDNVCVPAGKYLRRLLVEHVTDKGMLDEEIRTLVETVVLPWRDEILGIQ